MAVASTIIVSIISMVIIVFVNAFALWLAADKILGVRKGFRTALQVAVVSGLLSFLLSIIPTFRPTLVGNVLMSVVFFLVNAAVLIFLIHKFYRLHWSKTLLAWLIVTVVGFIVAFIVGALIGFIVPVL